MARPTHVSRALSQNFLTDRATADRFARLAVPRPYHPPLVLEVGAGKGALTEVLAPAAGNCWPTRSTHDWSPPCAPDSPEPLKCG